MNLDGTTPFILAAITGVSTLVSALLSWLYKLLRDDVHDLKTDNTKIREDAAKLREEIPTKYAQLGSMERMFEKLDTKLDKLFDRINEKADKP